MEKCTFVAIYPVKVLGSIGTYLIHVRYVSTFKSQACPQAVSNLDNPLP